MSLGNRIKAARNRLDWSQEQLARAAGTSQQNIDRIESGKVRMSRSLPAILKALGLSEETPTIQPQLVPIVGYAGAAAEIFTIDDHEKGDGIDHVDVPAGVMSLSSVAVIVRGDSMLPVYRNGDVIFYDRQYKGNLDHLIGKTCIVRLLDGRTLIKDLYRTDGTYTLISHNAAPIMGVIEWAAPVVWIKKA